MSARSLKDRLAMLRLTQNIEAWPGEQLGNPAEHICLYDPCHEAILPGRPCCAMHELWRLANNIRSPTDDPASFAP